MDNSSKFVWSAIYPNISDVDGDYYDSNFVFDPSNLTLDSPTINVVLLSSEASLSASQELSVASSVESQEGTESEIILYIIVGSLVTILVVIGIFVIYRKQKSS